MKRMKQKKSICFLIMVCMLFLGMCVENIHADSFFSYESSAHTASALISGEGITLTQQDYRIETNFREEYIPNSASSVHRVFTGNTRGTSLILLFVVILPQISPIILTSADCELANEASSCTVIVRYIHHKDGKKA